MENKITFVSCWYTFKAKFPSETYQEWIHNMLSNVNNYYLIIYTDNDGYTFLQKYSQPNILLIIRPFEDFFTYKYHEKWINNHKNNNQIKNKVDWQVNMLWSEKINFVKECVIRNIFKTDYFGWVDIGYFRNRPIDTSINLLNNWPNNEKIMKLNTKKIHYALINNNKNYLIALIKLINNKNNNGLPTIPIPENQISIAGGFFILHKERIDFWHKYYYSKLDRYFEYNYLIKDDQIIIADCIFSNPSYFELHIESLPNIDNWFMFQRVLL